MEQIKDKFISFSPYVTYSLIGADIVFDFDFIKDTIIWFGGLVLLVLQIRLYLIKIKEAKNK